MKFQWLPVCYYCNVVPLHGDGYSWRNGEYCVIPRGEILAKENKSLPPLHGDGYSWRNGEYFVIPRGEILAKENKSLPPLHGGWSFDFKGDLKRA